MTRHQEPSAFGQGLSRLRQQQRLTQAELARLAGLSVVSSRPWSSACGRARGCPPCRSARLAWACRWATWRASRPAPTIPSVLSYRSGRGPVSRPPPRPAQRRHTPARPPQDPLRDLTGMLLRSNSHEPEAVTERAGLVDSDVAAVSVHGPGGDTITGQFGTRTVSPLNCGIASRRGQTAQSRLARPSQMPQVSPHRKCRGIPRSM
jgi:hypothetical protein